MDRAFKVFDKDTTEIGKLSYFSKEDKFIFEYDADFIGYSFGEINIESGERVFHSDTLFGLFHVDESFGRELKIEKYNLYSLSPNELQLYIISNFIHKNNSNKGFYFEEIYSRLR